MANTFTLIQTTTVGAGGSASISFASIPGSYTDLILVVSGRTDRASIVDDVKIALNGVTSNMTLRSIAGNGTSALSAADTLIYGSMNGNNATASTFGSVQFYFPNYASSTIAKSVSIDAVSVTNGSTAYQYLSGGLWNPGTQAAITSITCTSYNAANYLQYSSASLYGIKNS